MKASQASDEIPAVVDGALGSSRSQGQGYSEQWQLGCRSNTKVGICRNLSDLVGIYPLLLET
jgi:hypothetical protein